MFIALKWTCELMRVLSSLWHRLISLQIRNYGFLNYNFMIFKQSVPLTLEEIILNRDITLSFKPFPHSYFFIHFQIIYSKIPFLVLQTWICLWITMLSFSRLLFVLRRFISSLIMRSLLVTHLIFVLLLRIQFISFEYLRTFYY